MSYRTTILLFPAFLLACGDGITLQSDTIAELNERLDALEEENAAQQAEIDAMTADYATESWVESQGYSTDSANAALQNLASYVSVDTTNDAVVFSGANVFIQSGAGSTDSSVNGLGNLIVGYDEGSADTKSGSHNLVVGKNHSYTSFGGFIAGFDNTISGETSTVSGGRDNEASGEYSVVSGGRANEASGFIASISGGYFNVASGNGSTVSGGRTTRPAETTAPSMAPPMRTPPAPTPTSPERCPL